MIDHTYPIIEGDDDTFQSLPMSNSLTNKDILHLNYILRCPGASPKSVIDTIAENLKNGEVYISEDESEEDGIKKKYKQIHFTSPNRKH